jgi:hypothetical protein
MNGAAAKTHDWHNIIPEAVPYHCKHVRAAAIGGKHAAISKRVLPIHDLNHLEPVQEGKAGQLDGLPDQIALSDQPQYVTGLVEPVEHAFYTVRATQVERDRHLWDRSDLSEPVRRQLACRNVAATRLQRASHTVRRASKLAQVAPKDVRHAGMRQAFDIMEPALPLPISLVGIVRPEGIIAIERDDMARGFGSCS